jgi:hypothetical protein
MLVVVALEHDWEILPGIRYYSNYAPWPYTSQWQMEEERVIEKERVATG